MFVLTMFAKNAIVLVVVILLNAIQEIINATNAFPTHIVKMEWFVMELMIKHVNIV